MSGDGSDERQELRALTAEIVAAYLAHNSVRPADIAGVIAAVHGSLASLGAPQAEAAPERPVPLVSAKKSITPDYLISLEDGGRYKSLKRHLAGRGLTPVEYRQKWGLAADYPMVAENYARRRSELAKSFGLGRKRTPEAQGETEPSRPGRKPAAEA